MSTTVVLLVSLPHDVDPDREVAVPADVLSALARAGQPTGHGLAKDGGGPWRLRYQLTGTDRVAVGRDLLARLRGFGYDADLSITP